MAKLIFYVSSFEQVRIEVDVPRKTMPDNTICCPRYDSNHVVKNGFIHNGNQNFKCKSCSRQFVLEPKNKVIEQGTRDLINKLLLEKLPLAGIARVTGVSERWLQIYVNTLYTSVSEKVEVCPKKRGD